MKIKHLMPSMCILCGGIFDASYDYQQGEMIAEEECKHKNKKGLVCWECRFRSRFKK